MAYKQILLDRIKNEFPKLKWEESEYIAYGWDHDVIILDDRIIFRFPTGQPHAGNLIDEIALLKALGKRISLPIPQYTFISSKEDFAGYSIIKGEQLKPWRYKEFSGEKKASVVKKLALFIAELHATPKALVDRYHVRIKDESKFLKETCVNAKKYIYPRISHRNRVIIEDFLRTTEKEITSRRLNKVLTHQDLVPEHILAKNGSISGVIDFSDRRYADPAYDFAGLWGYGPKFVESVYHKYEGRKDDRLLYRSKLIDKRRAIFIMTGSFLGYPCTFEQGYKMFKEQFLS